MESIEQQLSGLSPEQRRLVERWLEQQASAGREQPNEVEEPPDRLIPRRPATDVYPLSFGQQRLWLVDQMEPGSSFYNITSAVRLLGPLDVPVLHRCIHAIVRRHESLRTTFATRDGRPVAVVAASLALPLPLVDLSAWREDEREPRGLALVNEEAKRPFDLARGPLIRALLLRLGAQDHILLLTMHHTVSDGWSVGVVLRELGALYPALLAGRPAPLPELRIQYADYAYWQRHWLEGDGVQESPLQRQLAYWRSQLGGGTPPLNLPTDRPRTASHAFTTQGTKLPLWLPKILVDALVALGKQESATLYMMLLAALQILLQRYSGQDDITIGSPIANRNRDELEGMIGFFNNILVLRGNLSGDPLFRDLARQARETTLGAYAHQDVPFEHLVEALQPARTLSYPPLFQVLLGLQNQHTPLPTIKQAGLTLRPLKVDTGTARFDLSLSLGEVTHGLTGSLRYKTDLFDAETIARMQGHFQTLLEEIVANPDRRISDLPILTEAERRQLLIAWSDTASGARDQGSRVSAIADGCVHELVEAQAARAPDAVAIFFDAPTNDEGPMTNGTSPSSIVYRPSSVVQLTYAELNARANQLADYLRSRGVGPGVCVGVAAERSPELIVALLGVLKAGGAYLPLDPATPADRLAAMLDAAQAPVLVTNDEGRTTKDESDLLVTLSPCHLVNLAADWPVIAGSRGADALAAPAFAEQPACVAVAAHAGQAVAVPIPHQAATNLLRSLSEQPGVAASDTVLSLLPGLDMAALDLLLPLVAGARLALSEQPAAEGPRAIDALARSGATVLLAPPAALRRLLDAGWAGDRRLSVICDAPIAPLLAERLRERTAALWQMYGRIECAGWTIATRVADGVVASGRAISASQAYILDRRMRPLPVGIVGELYIGGAGLAHGYLGRPDLTAERFIPNPFGATNDERRRTNDEAHPSSFVLRPSSKTRLYRTGDLARYRPGGLVELVAPPVADEQQIAREQAFIAPRTPVEEALAGIWSSVIGREQIGVNDDFFQLGGHSLNAALLVSRVRETFQVNLPLRSLFEATTVTAMARLIIANETRPGQTEKIALTLKRIKSMSASDRQKVLEQKRKARGQA